MNKYYSFIIFCLCLISCSDKTEIKGMISVDLEDITQPSIYDIFSDISVIPLETTTESLIKFISKVEYYQNRYYILDKRLHAIFVFDSKGKYLYKINDRGEGPNNYIDLTDFEIDKKREKIMILSAGARCLNYYNMEGKFLKKLRLPKISLYYYKLQLINNDTIVFSTPDGINKLKYYSIKENVIIHEDSINEQKDHFHPNQFMMEGFLSYGLSNTVYSLKNGKTEKAYTWDFGENNDLSNLNTPKGFDYNAIKKHTSDVYSSTTVNYVLYLQGQNDRYIYAMLIIENKTRNILYDKETKRSMVFEKTKEGATICPIKWDNDYIISAIGGYIDLNDLEFDDLVPNEIRTPELSKIINNIKEEDNPVLIKHTFINK